MNEKLIRKSSSGLNILGVDFDGTLFSGPTENYPIPGDPIWKIHEYVKNKKDNGWYIILWTCRGGRDLDLALKKCKEYGIEFDYVNENHPEIIKRGYDHRKIFATIYLDDRNLNPITDI